MRQRIKRRVFMMSMALATGAACPAFAKAAEKDHAGGRFAVLPDEDAGGRQAGLFDSMKQMLAGQGAGTAGKRWQLELLPPEPRHHFDTDARPVQARRWGLALRLAF